METSLVIKSTTTSQKDTTKSVQNINPSATEANLYNFAVSFMQLSTNTFVSVARVDKTTLQGGGE